MQTTRASTVSTTVQSTGTGGGDGAGTVKSKPKVGETISKSKQQGSAKNLPSKTKVKKGGGDASEEQKDAPAGEDLYNVASDELMDLFVVAQEVQKGPRVIKRASGFEILEQLRLGPDIIDDGWECTPLPHWMGKEILPNYSVLMSKASDEIVPITPTDSKQISNTGFDIRRYQQTSKSPPMSWNASLTTLEEEEFKAETEMYEDYQVIHKLLVEDEAEKVYLSKEVKVTFPDGSTMQKRRFRVVLTECETVYTLELHGKFELETIEGHDLIAKSNERYKHMVQHHLESDAYSNRFAQTFEARLRDQSTEYRSPLACDVGVQANYYMIEDEYEAYYEAEARRKLREEEAAQMRALQERMKMERDAIAIQKDEDEDSDDEELMAMASGIDWKKYGSKYDEEEEDDDAGYRDVEGRELEYTDDEDEFDTAVPLEEIYERQRKKEAEASLTVLPDISMAVVFLDRLISMEFNQDNQADMRGYPVLNANRDYDDKKENKPHFFNLIEDNRGKQAQLDLGPNIKRYWSLKTNITKGREVTDIALHPKNGNMIAAAYGTHRFGDDEEGMVCVWSAKNTLYPERIFEFRSAVTCLAFATLTPYLLAVGMLDGNLVVYDVRSYMPLSMSSTLGSPDKHEGPIWQVCWFQEQEMATTGSVNEILLSLGDDGKLNRWTSTKGFDFSTMLRVRRSPLKIPGRRERRAEALTSNLAVAFSLCFYPNDWTQYLIGTEEGFIHKCSTSFTEQFLGSYVGHSGPVYRIVFNSFDKSIFVSASGDWSVKVWREGTYAPLLSMQTGLRTMFDVTCCPTMSSVFVCASEFHVEVWDLTLNTLEPVVQFAPPFAVAFRRAVYSSYLNAVILGDDEGAVTLYGLRDFPRQPKTEEEQMEQLLEGLIPGYKKRMKDAAAEEAHYEQYFVDEPAQNTGGSGDGENAHELQSTEMLVAGNTAEAPEGGRTAGEHEGSAVG